MLMSQPQNSSHDTLIELWLLNLGLPGTPSRSLAGTGRAPKNP